MMLCMIQRWYTMYCIVHVVLTFYLVKCYTQHCPLVLVITKTMLCIFWHFILIPLDNLWEEKVLFANIFAILKMSFVQCVGLRTAKSRNRSWTQRSYVDVRIFCGASILLACWQLFELLKVMVHSTVSIKKTLE